MGVLLIMKSFHTKFLAFAVVLAVLGVFALSPDTASARKSKAKKLSEEEITQINETVSGLTQKIYAAGLFSPDDNKNLIEVKSKVDTTFMANPTSLDFPVLYYKLAFIYKKREYKEEAIECYTTILENFSDSPYFAKAHKKLKKMGIKIELPSEEEEE